MAKNLYVGNLSYSMTEDKLQTLFAECGPVESAKVITDRYTGRSRGFGFVEMATEDGAKEAIDSLNGKEVDGRQLRVAEAKPRQDRDQRRAPDRRSRW
jgi:RNA recognition motif-containing protein